MAGIALLAVGIMTLTAMRLIYAEGYKNGRKDEKRAKARWAYWQDLSERQQSGG